MSFLVVSTPAFRSQKAVSVGHSESGHETSEAGTKLHLPERRCVQFVARQSFHVDSSGQANFSTSARLP